MSYQELLDYCNEIDLMKIINNYNLKIPSDWFKINVNNNIKLKLLYRLYSLSGDIPYYSDNLKLKNIILNTLIEIKPTKNIVINLIEISNKECEDFFKRLFSMYSEEDIIYFINYILDNKIYTYKLEILIGYTDKSLNEIIYNDENFDEKLLAYKKNICEYKQVWKYKKCIKKYYETGRKATSEWFECYFIDILSMYGKFDDWMYNELKFLCNNDGENFEYIKDIINTEPIDKKYSLLYKEYEIKKQEKLLETFNKDIVNIIINY